MNSMVLWCAAALVLIGCISHCTVNGIRVLDESVQKKTDAVNLNAKNLQTADRAKPASLLNKECGVSPRRGTV